jgi:hypothetical protein
VAPFPLLVLLVTIELAVFSMRDSVGFDAPRIVIHGFVVVPGVIIAIVEVIDSLADADTTRTAGNPLPVNIGPVWQTNCISDR